MTPGSPPTLTASCSSRMGPSWMKRSSRKGAHDMGIRLTLAARYIGGRRLRALLTTLAVVFGVLIIFGMNIMVPTMMQSFQSGMMAASDTVDLTASLKTGTPFPAAIVDKVAGIDGVRAAHGVLVRTLNIPV